MIAIHVTAFEGRRAMLRIYKKQNVYDAALDRIRYIFDEFPNITIAFSGGKDSTVILNLALKVAEERGRLPLPVFWFDQEAEWQLVVDYARRIKADPRIDFRWFQVEFLIENATSATESHITTWEAGREWMRPKEPDAIQENVYGTNEFHALFTAMLAKDYPPKTALLAGIRAEESPGRFSGLTAAATYKAVTWGRIQTRSLEQYGFYPLYDWSYTDIWKAIHSNGWDYCKVYDVMYQHGYNINDMRVSSLHHATAVRHTFHAQEIDGATWSKLTERLQGVNSAGQLQAKDWFIPKVLPPMFVSWKEYRDFLTEKLITDPTNRSAIQKKFAAMDEKFENFPDLDKMYRQMISVVLSNDIYFVKLTNWEVSPEIVTWKKWWRGRRVQPNRIEKNKFIQMDIRRGRRPENEGSKP